LSEPLWSQWSSGWIKEGHFISFLNELERRYYYVRRRDFARYIYRGSSLSSGGDSGPIEISDLEITEIKDKRVWQLIFGFKPNIYVYVYLPSDVFRHGVPKRQPATPTFRLVGHYEQWMSPFDSPSFITEHFLARNITTTIWFRFYNPEDITVTPMLNFFINKLDVEFIGSEDLSTGTLTPSNTKWTETLEKLAKRTIPCRPITLRTVSGPATGR